MSETISLAGADSFGQVARPVSWWSSRGDGVPNALLLANRHPARVFSLFHQEIEAHFREIFWDENDPVWKVFGDPEPCFGLAVTGSDNNLVPVRETKRRSLPRAHLHIGLGRERFQNRGIPGDIPGMEEAIAGH